MNASPARPGSPHPVRAVVGAIVVLTLDAALLAAGLGGARAVIADPRALALLGVWGGAGLVLALARPVRAQDVTRREPDVLRMLALLVLPLVIPAVGAFGARTDRWLLPAPAVVSWAGVTLVAAGLAVRMLAMAQLGARFSPLVALQREHPLESRGLYAHVRHPGYAGSLLAALGGALAFGSALALPLVLAFAGLLAARIRVEERLLAGHFGDEWTRYAARTGALLPRANRARS